MAIELPSGMAGQIGFNTEGTYGTGTTVTRFLPLVSESVTHDPGRIEASGIYAGRRVMRSNQWARGVSRVVGDVAFELTDNSMGMLWRHCFGTVNSVGGGTPSTHKFWPSLLTGLGFTMQVGRPDIAGTVLPFTYSGCKVASWEIAGEADKPGTMGVSVFAQNETLGTALAAASFGTDNLLTFTGGLFTIAGAAPTRVRSFKLSGDNGLDLERVNAGGTVMLEPLEQALREYMGEAVLDLGGTIPWLRVTGGTEAAVVLGFTGGAGGTNSLKFTMNARFDGDGPVIGGPGVLEQKLVFKALSNTSDEAAISGTLVNNDVVA
jgi:hypothetical protein